MRVFFWNVSILFEYRRCATSAGAMTSAVNDKHLMPESSRLKRVCGTAVVSPTCVLEAGRKDTHLQVVQSTNLRDT